MNEALREHIQRRQQATISDGGPRKTSGVSRFAAVPHRGRRRAVSKVSIALRVNDEATEVSFAPHKTLLEVLREDLGLVGTKHGCELGECGACAVLVDGKPMLSCLVLGLEATGRSVSTIEGMAEGPSLHPLQDAFADLGAAQCGYCTPGILLTAKALLAEKPQPTRAEIREALSGNLCRCTGYLQIFEAVEDAVLRIAAGNTKHEVAAQ